VSITKLGPEREARQEPEHDPAWQDSVVMCWWDLASGIGGYHRIGHQPRHPDGPRAHLSTAIFTADRVFKRNVSVPLTDADRLPGGGWAWNGGECAYTFGDHAQWMFAHAELSGELHVRDFHQPVDIYPKGGQVSERITSGHLEAGGRIEGTLRFDGRDYTIDGLAFRDHGWGKRHWNEVLAHRWVVATFEDGAVALAISILASAGQIAGFGAVIDGENYLSAREVDIETTLLPDGLTHRGGRARMVLESGETVELTAEPLQKGVIFWMADQFAITDTLCRYQWGERVGIGTFELSNNPLAGSARPLVAINGVLDDGLHVV
jgi:hypothetical protein